MSDEKLVSLQLAPNCIENGDITELADKTYSAHDQDFARANLHYESIHPAK